MTTEDLCSTLGLDRGVLADQLRRFRIGILTAAGEDYAGSLQAAESIRHALEHRCEHVGVVHGIPALMAAIGAHPWDLLVNVDYSDVADNGSLTALCDACGLRVTGNSFLPTALMWHKGISKGLLKSAGIRIPAWIAMNSADTDDAECLSRLVTTIDAANLTWPLVVKPAASSVSNGVRLVVTASELPIAVHEAARFSNEVLIEEFVRGTELSIAVLGRNEKITTLPAVEIVLRGHNLQSHEVKFTPGMKENRIPARLTDDKARQLAHLATRCHRALHSDCVSRIDLIDDGSEFSVLEANGNPGLLPSSLLPLEAREVGISYDDLIFIWVGLSLQRYQ